jgi:hypothetical protein
VFAHAFRSATATHCSSVRESSFQRNPLLDTIALVNSPDVATADSSIGSPVSCVTNKHQRRCETPDEVSGHFHTTHGNLIPPRPIMFGDKRDVDYLGRSVLSFRSNAPWCCFFCRLQLSRREKPFFGRPRLYLHVSTSQ